MEANPALPSSRPSSQYTKQHTEAEHKCTHDYADRSQNPRVARERDSSRVRDLVFIHARTAIRRSSEHSADEHEEKAECRKSNLAVRSYYNPSYHETTLDLLHPQA